MSIHLTYSYVSTKEKIIAETKHSSKQTILSLQKNITNLLASYSVNEYDNLILNEMETQPHYSIVVEDYNMGKIIGKSAYISGKIRDNDWNIINFDSDNSEHINQLNSCFYSDKHDITASSGQKLGTITIYSSDHSMNRELNKIITETIVNTFAISLLLIFSLLITIRLFILKPISNIISVIRNSDDDGIPVDLIKSDGSTEIFTLSNTMNSMISSIRDSRVKLTKQRNELKAREDQLKTLSMATEQSPVSVIICDPDNIIEYANPQFVNTSGFDINEVIGRSIEFLFQYNSNDKNQATELNESLQSGKKWIGEITPDTKMGEYYYLRLSASPILMDDGTVTHHIYVAEDITDHKRNEEMLRISQKMDAMGQLTGGVAHDFNNLLGIIMGNLELLKMSLKDHPKELERIDKALAGTERGAHLTRKLLNITRQSHTGQLLAQINPFIENLHELIAKSVTASIQVETHLSDNLWPVNIEQGDLEDAILNLSLNARDAMPNGGMLVIETSNKHLDANYVKHNPSAKEGDYVMVSVSDTGTGINKETRKKIFDPFFTTKELGKGTGLGLSMVYGFVKRSGGYIQLYSEEGSGSTFHIYLPRAISDHDDQIVDSDKTDLPRGDETILIVDDENDLAETAQGILNQLGYQTRTANSAEQALDILSSTDGIDLVFSDVVMPSKNGFELSFAVLKHKPTLKILLTSGFTSKHMEYTNGEKEIYQKLARNLLGKPYNYRELAMAIRHTLDKQ